MHQMPLWFKLICHTDHEYVICVWNLAPSSEQFTEIIKLRHGEIRMEGQHHELRVPTDKHQEILSSFVFLCSYLSMYVTTNCHGSRDGLNVGLLQQQVTHVVA